VYKKKDIMTHIKSKFKAQSLSKNSKYGKHILKTINRNGREWQLHATKGWRNYSIFGLSIGKPDR
jgi:hypothetical protein